MQNQSNVFTFYLDESLWFKEGQGVRELIGISLEPEISIEEFGQEVRLTGTVALAGEYMLAEEEQWESGASSSRFVDTVEEGEEGAFHFSHAFPVEISVPLNRVSSLDDVHVDISSFDYELPEQNQLRLHAQLNINGIESKSSAQHAESFDESTTFEPVDFNQKEVEERTVVPEQDAPVIQLNEYEAQDKSENVETAESGEEGRWHYKKSQSFSEFFGHEQKEEEETESISSESSVQVEDSSISYAESSSSAPSVSSSVSSSDKHEAKPAPTGMDGIKQVFKHLFPNRDESYTQMKMYIVQEEETLESIADRYGISVKQLERINEYESEVSPGQIVYIPR
ncbi:stage VI sporulation protein D [Halobacillus fulvus]|nr:stage VI sporulation protein D [Halobacillus fulvus]